MEAKHTPGPWQAVWRIRSDVGQEKGWHVVDLIENDADGSIICELPDENDFDINQANVNLIAASPDLLTSLQEMVSELLAHAQLGLNSDEVAMLKRAEAAIAKATKGTP